MGTIQHHAILATTWSDEIALAFQDWLVATLGPSAYLWSEQVINGNRTFLIPPDGSKEGWEDSNTGDDIRNMVIKRLQADNYEDDSSPWEWVEVSYGELGQSVTRGNNYDRIGQ